MSPGDPASGRMVPHFVKEFIQMPDWPPKANGKAIPTIAPSIRAVSHFISGQHPQRVLDQPLERLHQPRSVGAVDGAVVEAAGRAHHGRDL